MTILDVLQDTIEASRPVMLYGAGENAQNSIYRLQKLFNIIGIWDKNLCGSDICGFRVMAPFEKTKSGKTGVVLVTIKDEAVRSEVTVNLKRQGYDKVFFSDIILRILDEINMLSGLDNEEYGKNITDFKFIDGPHEPVNYSVVKPSNSHFSMTISEEIKQEILNELRKCLLIEKEETDRLVDVFFTTLSESPKDFYEAYELLLRQLLSGGVKTKYRPIRMVGDVPYDEFAVYETQKIVIGALCSEKADAAIKLTNELIEQSYTNKYLRAVKGSFLLEKKDYHGALRIAEELVRDYPTDFLANDILFQAVRICSESGLKVAEKLPSIDLTKRFCWSGLTFAWFGGFDKKGKAVIAPCFRAIECAARPEGEFSDSEEWRLFRESILDGSFRYCQKLQCPNIVGGWLPEKKKSDHSVIKELIENKSQTVPSPEEIHLSYDRHCNLSCPSCRTTFCTYDEDMVKRFDAAFEREIASYLRSARHLCLSGSGEALLSPHSRKILLGLPKYADPELKVELRTNMTVLNERTWEELGEGRNFIKHIAASIDSCSEELFEKLRYPAKWKNVIKNLEFVKNLRNTGQIELFEFHVVVQEANIEELTDIAQMALKYDADAVTYSKIVNWQGMSREQYDKMNPFYEENPKHDRFLLEIGKLKRFREEHTICSNGKGKAFYINIHFEEDPDESYDPIRYGELKIR